jgi:hypothetical protein
MMKRRNWKNCNLKWRMRFFPLWAKLMMYTTILDDLPWDLIAWVNMFANCRTFLWAHHALMLKFTSLSRPAKFSWLYENLWNIFLRHHRRSIRFWTMHSSNKIISRNFQLEHTQAPYDIESFLLSSKLMHDGRLSLQRKYYCVHCCGFSDAMM